MRITSKGQVTIPSEAPEVAKRRPLSEEPFVGMWRDREDIGGQRRLGPRDSPARVDPSLILTDWK